MNKILISSDLLRPLVDSNGHIEYFHKARLDKYYFSLVYQISQAVNVPVEKFSYTNTDFDMFKFYSLCNTELRDVYSWLRIYDLQDIPNDAVEYYKKYIENSLVIYHEAPNIIKKIHNILNIPYIDLNVHPIRFLDDNFWGMLTNNEHIFNRIKKHQIDERSFYIYANLIKSQVKSWYDSKIEPDSLLFTGQTNIDKSLYSNNKAMTIYDFEDKIKEFGEKYSKVYYKAHPYNDDLKNIYEFLEQFDFVNIIDENFYKLCSDENIKAVASITSGTLYEAKYFNKESIFLGKPYINLNYDKNCEYSEFTTLSIYNEFLTPQFWADILQDVLDVKTNIVPLVLPHRTNEIRTAFGDYWGQTELDPSVKINEKTLKKECECLKGELTEKTKEIWFNMKNINKDLYTLNKTVENKTNKLFYREKIGNKRIIHLLGIKFSYKKKEKIKPSEHDQCNKFIFGKDAIEKLIQDYKFDTVLDIGCGEGLHSEIFKSHGKTVTSLDYGKSPYVLNKENNQDFIIADFLEYDFYGKQYDAVWCSHVLEHQSNVNIFLRKINSVLKENGVLAITVPPLKSEIVGGHVCLWNAGLLLYNLVLAGFDCKKAIVKKYGYNISVIVKKKNIDIKSKLVFDNGDISTIRKYLPNKIKYNKNFKDISFNGDIENINW